MAGGTRQRQDGISSEALSGREIRITGVVQGVGFRPFVYRLAQRYQLTGWVRNTSAGVDIRADAPEAVLLAFEQALRDEAPPLARIDSLTARPVSPDGFASFEIRFSEAQAGEFMPISPDIAICDDCRRELLNPSDRRYRYPFINCTNCGPRFTIIKDIPYDRPQTTMAPFDFCPTCEAEYHDPLNRRFHAQPVACADCGPQVWLEVGGETTASHDDAMRAAVDLLHSGKIVAIRGLGGFHLACDATNEAAVAELRRRKRRIGKPFALMVADLAAAATICEVPDEARRLLTGQEHPIVLLDKRAGDTSIAASVAPNQTTLGLMLPYTPLHVLLFPEGQARPLVMTSGNLSEEPVVTTNEAARAKLGEIADAFLLHNRDIHIRNDDSVVRVFRGEELPIRRSRGYAPYPVALREAVPNILAVGGEVKNTFCLTRDKYAFMSHHIGDMENYATVQSFEDGIRHFERLFRIAPQIIAHDLHPDYAATRYALRRAADDGLPALAVQHHHAHIAAVMAEHQHAGDRPVLGVSFDGTGFGTDGTIWGGECLLASYRAFERVAWLKPFALAGGDAATRKPARIALALLHDAGVALDDDLPPVAALSATERQIVLQQIERGLNSPLTSSVGRLFDAVAALLGVRQTVTYEGQAAIELEAIVDRSETGRYAFDLSTPAIDPAPVITAIVADLRAGVAAGAIAARFHNAIADALLQVCTRQRRAHGVSALALSGGVFQNVTLLGQLVPALEQAGFTVLHHRRVPSNDGGLALGQALIAHHIARHEGLL